MTAAAVSVAPDAAIAAANGDENECCAAHLERTGEKRPAYKLGLCRDCWMGKALVPSSMWRARPPQPAKTKRRLSPDHRLHISQAMRRRWAQTGSRRGELVQ